MSQAGDESQGESAVETAVAATMDALQAASGTQVALGTAGTRDATGTITVASGTPHAASTPTATLAGGLVMPSVSPTSTPTAASTLLPSPTGSLTGPTPTNNPAASPSSSPTSSPTSVPPATDTDEPPPATNTTVPSSTPAPTATNPPADPCAAVSIGRFSRDGKTVSWVLDNNSSSPQMVTSIRLTWPGDNQSLFKVDFAGSTIWVGDEPVSPASISSWIGGETSRTFSGGQPIQFRFKANAVDGSYALVVNFSSGCRLSR